MLRSATAIILAAMTVSASAEQQPTFEQTRAQDLRPQIDEVFERAGLRPRGISPSRCGDSQDLDGWVQCNFYLTRYFRVLAYARTEENEAELVRMRPAENGVPVSAYIEPASVLVRTIEFDSSEAQILDLVGQIAQVQYSLGRQINVVGARGVYSFSHNANGTLIFEIRPVSRP